MTNHPVSPAQLLVRCYVERKGDQWQAFSLEFGLAAQADSLPEAKRKLELMIASYVFDALVGEDREHAAELLSRRAGWGAYAKYYFLSSVGGISSLRNRWRDSQAFDEPLPLEPKLCPV